MQIAYYDESGDDGYPQYSSPLFVLSVLYLHHLNWKKTYTTIQDFRRELNKDFSFPNKLEMHTKQFLLNKYPYKDFNFSVENKIKILTYFCDLIGDLNINIINVVINKPRIRIADYKVLDMALKFSVQRIENDLDLGVHPNNRFMIITDTGRVGKMRKTTRRIQRVNYIPTRFGEGSYRKEIQSLVEDPLPKDSKESYFIQLADVVAYIVYMYSLVETGAGGIANRLATFLSRDQIVDWVDRLKPSFNLKASGSDPYGIVYHPK